MSRLLLRNCRLIDGMGHDPFDCDLLIEGSDIVSVHAAGAAAGGVGTPAFDLALLTVLPGLIDAHTHLGIVGNKLDEAVPLAVAAAQIFDNCGSALDSGYTTVRDLGGIDGGVATAVASGLVRGPRILPSGPIISEVAGNGDLLSHYAAARVRDQGWPGLSTIGAACNGPLDVARATRLALRRGATQIKVSASTLVEPDDIHGHGGTELTIEEMAAAVAEARAKGTYVTAHSLNAAGVRNALAAGVRCIEHGGVSDESVADAMREVDAALVPTLSLGWLEHEERAVAAGLAVPVPTTDRTWGLQIRDSMAVARTGGVRVGFGSDLEGPQQTRRGLELALRSVVESPMAAIVAATSANADIIARPRLGTVAVGQLADITVVDGDPIQEPLLWTDPNRVVLVIKDGAIVKNMLDAARRAD